MSARSLAILETLAVAAFGCAIEQGQSPYKNSRGEPVFSRMEEYDQPGGLFTIAPAVKNRITCPHCGAVNILGQATCDKCSKRLSLLPVWKTCTACEGRGMDSKGSPCKDCKGRGWVKLPDEE